MFKIKKGKDEIQVTIPGKFLRSLYAAYIQEDSTFSRFPPDFLDKVVNSLKSEEYDGITRLHTLIETVFDDMEDGRD